MVLPLENLPTDNDLAVKPLTEPSRFIVAENGKTTYYDTCLCCDTRMVLTKEQYDAETVIACEECEHRLANLRF